MYITSTDLVSSHPTQHGCLHVGALTIRLPKVLTLDAAGSLETWQRMTT